MASPYVLSNTDLQYLNASGQAYSIFVAFLNPLAITTNWVDINMDAAGNWQPPPNVDTAHLKIAPYAPQANMGSNRIGFVGEPLYFDGTRSCQRFDLPVVSYAWSADGPPTRTTYANGAQVALSWQYPGVYTVSLTVTDHSGTAMTARRQVMIYQDRQSALPGMIQLSGPQGSLSNGGWQAQINTVNSQYTLFSPEFLPVGTYQPVVLMIETQWEIAPGVWQTRTIGPNGQFNPGYPYSDPRILLDGYIQTGTLHQDVDKDTLSFTIVGPQQLLNDAQCHLIGYYNCAYTSVIAGVPQSCVPSPMGKGYMVGGLMTADVVHSILQDHSTIAAYHDVHLWNAAIPTQAYSPGSATPAYLPVYATLSVNEGSLWDNLSTLAANEFAQVWCERDGSIRMGPQLNLRGGDIWNMPTLLGQTEASTLLNLIQDLGYTGSLPSTLAALAGNLPQLPSLPMPLAFVHPWAMAVPNGIQNSFSGAPPPEVTQFLYGLNGPPVLCVFSDVPALDSAPAPPVTGENPWVVWPGTSANWPQDLAIYPIDFDITENYTGRTSLVKLIGTLALAQSILTSWYPQTAFAVTGDGTSTIVTSTLPLGNWVVDESHVLPDMTTALNKNLVLNYWWEMAYRYYWSLNVYYNATITAGTVTFLSLGDLIGVTRQNNTLGGHCINKPFYVTDLAFQLDMSNRTFSTSIVATEVTSAAMGSIIGPPAVIPKG